MHDIEKQIITAVHAPGYQPLKPKALSRKLGLSADQYADFKSAVRKLIKEGRLELAKNSTIRPASAANTVTGVFRRTTGGFGFVRPGPVPGGEGAGGKPAPEIYIPQEAVGDASTGDTVLVRIRRKAPRPDLGPRGQVVRVLERVTKQFVGTYFERDGQGLVRVDGTVFSHSIYVGDPGAKGARPEDKVVFEMLRFPTSEDRGEGVITEILGPRGKPGVDTLSIIKAFGLPEEFAADALEEARSQAAQFNDKDLAGRQDFTGWTTITIDPADARDFDDAVSLTQDPQSKHWLLGVHIADVGDFAPPGSALDREARKRGTSVYLPQRVIPMFPEIISNSLASLQQGKVRFVKSVLVDLTPLGVKTDVRFANAAIRTKRRFTYEQVLALLEDPHGAISQDLHVEPEILELLWRMRDLAVILNKRRLKRGYLQLHMPEPELEYDKDGRVTGAHFRKNDISHQMIEEFMLLANEAVAETLDRRDIAFLRRVHPAPEPTKLKAFAEFARILGYKVQRETDRFTLQRILNQSANKPEAHAVHYALLRSLKQAIYSPHKEDHYALASENYCHFTSPIRRYPDLVVHRLLDQLIRRGRAGSDFEELTALGEHCSKMERRAETAERELIKLKLLTYLSERLGMEMEVVITGVADYGFYGQAEILPVEGLVHISTLPDDYYYFDQASHSLIGQRTKRRYRLGDKVKVKVVRVDLQKRQADLKVIERKRETDRRKRD
jgi:ribonuclease R